MLRREGVPKLPLAKKGSNVVGYILFLIKKVLISMTTKKKTTKKAASRKTASKTKKELNGAEALIKCLENLGVEYIWGLSGGAAIPIFDALVGSKIKLILVRHEQGAAHMATDTRGRRVNPEWSS